MSADVVNIRDYDRPEPDREKPDDGAIIIILPVIRIERYEDREARYDAGLERAGFGRPIRPGFGDRLRKILAADQQEL